MISPKGFLKNFLRKQMNGLTGHIEEAKYPFDTVEWGKADILTDNENPQWWVYEQTAYWLDGYLRAAILLQDEQALKRASRIVYNVFLRADGDGYLGPKFLKRDTFGDSFNRWPHVVFFRACMALYGYNRDTTVLEKLTAHYLGSEYDFSRGRNVLNVEIMLWLYGETDDKRLLKLAEETYRTYNERCEDDLCDRVALSPDKPYAHGVSYNEYSKLGAILYAYTGKKQYLKASVAAYKKIDKFFMLIDGLHCSDEFMISNEVMRSHETCCVTDFTWSLNYLYEATGKSDYLDKIEKCIFNAGLGSVTDDFKALQYFSCVNQLVLDGTSNHNSFFKGSKWMSYRPNPGTECCPGNVNRFMPNYVMNMWSEKEDGVYLKLYGASEYFGKGFKIVEETEYPFKNTVRLTVESVREFTLRLRVPKWAEGYSLSFDGEWKEDTRKGFLVLNVTKNCQIELSFDCSVKMHKKRNYAWFTKGCLVYAYKPETVLETDLNEERSSKEFPAYNAYATGDWAWGVKEDGTVVENDDGTLSVEAYALENWSFKREERVKRCVNLYKKVYEKVRGDFTFTPSIPREPILKSGEKRLITLIPYGKTLCRITAFPKIK